MWPGRARKSSSLGGRAEGDRLVPVLRGLGEPLEPVVSQGTVPMAVPQELLGGDIARLLLVNGLQTVDGPAEPFQTRGRIAAIADQFAEVAVTATEIDLISGHGGELGGQFLPDRQGLAVLLLRLVRTGSGRDL